MRPESRQREEEAPEPVKGFRYFELTASAVEPIRATPGSAGYDLSSAENARVEARSTRLVRTDLAFEFPEGCYGRVLGRSGLSLNGSVAVLGGVIDNDYTGEVGVILHNLSDEPFDVRQGDRIAQIVCKKYDGRDLEYGGGALDNRNRRFEYGDPKDIKRRYTRYKRGASGFGSSGTETAARFDAPLTEQMTVPVDSESKRIKIDVEVPSSSTKNEHEMLGVTCPAAAKRRNFDDEQRRRRQSREAGTQTADDDSSAENKENEPVVEDSQQQQQSQDMFD